MTIDGPRLVLGDRTFVVAPATIGAIKRQMQGYAKHEPGTAERLDVSLAFVLAVLKRNDPDVTIEFLEDAIDARNMPDVMSAIAGSAGYEETKPGETAAT